MTMRRGCLPALLAGLLLLGALGWVLGGWYLSGPLKASTAFVVPDGSSLSSVAAKLEAEGAVDSASAFRWRARIFAGGAPIKAGEFMLPKGASPAKILSIIQGDEILRRFVTIPEGMPSIMVYERLMAHPGLTGGIAVPPEGSILPDTYEIQRGESRQAVLLRMQAAMQRTLAEAWEKRAPGIAVRTPQEALALAAIVEKETGKPEERRIVAGLYSNRLRQGIMLQADPTIIYPITKGKPLGRRIRQSEIQAVNDYNTYSMLGLPKGPITNPGRASIEAVLNPAQTDALYMVADGTGGHLFATTLEQHNANVERWYTIRKQRGDF
ncbi:endolytic transglycosylase MltG [Novosphingobium sp.]|uniref:endolytic transglycosylase MltG n=1 Tax=Novosphingobium sp. TaxID=1874826 RepID=UPI001ECD1013|nr:endolytic transglycosylase MltG [Novosphingobium sp.]MBK6801001.1 endolytic transglycosylase MltG [Novosphingobium sp.]MBK9011559.1 endolytic transglycosylase MltG [Novosphingobium sp.]